MNLEEVTREEKEYISELMKLVYHDPNIHTSTPFMIRFRKCDFSWDQFFRVHISTSTPIPRISNELLEVIRIPYEDIPLYINNKYISEPWKKRDVDLQTLIAARLKLGR